jgi:hypothetical protein
MEPAIGITFVKLPHTIKRISAKEQDDVID